MVGSDRKNIAWNFKVLVKKWVLIPHYGWVCTADYRMLLGTAVRPVPARMPYISRLCDVGATDVKRWWWWWYHKRNMFEIKQINKHPIFRPCRSICNWASHIGWYAADWCRICRLSWVEIERRWCRLSWRLGEPEGRRWWRCPTKLKWSRVCCSVNMKTIQNIFIYPTKQTKETNVQSISSVHPSLHLSKVTIF